jgi:hypothetical protein
MATVWINQRTVPQICTHFQITLATGVSGCYLFIICRRVSFIGHIQQLRAFIFVKKKVFCGKLYTINDKFTFSSIWNKLHVIWYRIVVDSQLFMIQTYVVLSNIDSTSL